jgi:hypothetical protein
MIFSSRFPRAVAALNVFNGVAASSRATVAAGSNPKVSVAT